MANIFFKQKIIVGEDVKKLNPLYAVTEDVKWYNLYGKQYSDYSKNKNRIIICNSNSTSGSVQFSSATQSYLTLRDPMNCSTPGLPVHNQLPSSLKLTFIESVMPSSHLILCCPLLLLPPIPPSIRVFSNESTLCMT